jgi:predicted CXXCH cytochrome family protein
MEEMNRWEIVGLIATLVIVLSVPAYVLKVEYLRPVRSPLQAKAPPAFVGSKKCMDCHKKEYDRWKGSHHDHAMDVADERSVLGDFSNAVFEHRGVKSKFYRKNGRFFTYTVGPEGKMGEYEITHTFGWYPLQQYLVPFPGGRLQCLPIAWDVVEKRWYHLVPDDPPDPKNWLYWTNAAQNWNGMCAQCHSTNLKKNYDPMTDTYRTTWSEIDVGCEACHGPGSLHVEWAEMPDMARAQVDNLALVVRTSGLTSRKLVELCAPCHSRRAGLGDYTHSETDLLDVMLPSLLTEGLYFPDGQILEEVYVYGSFTQSKMYHRNVRCSDCHDVHSIKMVKQGNDLCLQCHRADEYDTKEHHFHKKKGEKGDPIKSADGKVLFEVGTGAECRQCHMPGRYYMGVDYRLDHSFRIPRPELSVKIRTPNTCNRCHLDKTNQWSEGYITKWYGPGLRPHYGTVLYAGRERLPGAKEALIRLAGDVLYPVIVRSTALSLLSAYSGEEVTRAFALALMDDEALIRRTAVENLNTPDLKKRVAFIAPSLFDPVKAVRIEAARRLADEPSKSLAPDQRKMFEVVLQEFEAAMEYTADFASSRTNLGNLYVSMNRPEEAIRNYQAAIRIDDLFYPAKVNLAMFYNRQGQNDEAEKLLKEVLKAYPQMHDVAYSLGLLLAEKKQYEEAALYLEMAAKGLPDRARVYYNLGLLLEVLKREGDAEAALRKALKLEPDTLDFMYALADFYLKRGDLPQAKALAEQMVSKHPEQRIGHELLQHLDKNR